MTLHGRHPATGAAIAVHVRNGVIERIESSSATDCPYLSPGWLDLQVNGFAGVDYNDPRSPADEIARSIAVQRSTGVTCFYPTVITGSQEDMLGSLRNLARAKRTLQEGGCMLGFHVEGPWISPHDGPRGAHPRKHVRPPSIEEFRRFQGAADGNVRLLTLSPEYEEAPRVIQHMAEAGVVVSIGHTGATALQIVDAIAAGATMSTHLGNGAHATVPRHDNYITQQLANDRLYAGLIVDGIHLPECFVKIALRTKGLSKSILVTDAVAPAHCAPGTYKLGEQDVELLPEQRVELLGSRRLAGSALSMDRGIRNAMRFAGLSLLEATRLATANPAKAMGLVDRSGYLEPGQCADFTLFWVENGGYLRVERVLSS